MRQAFLVRGMDCAHETALLRRELEGADGVDDLGFDVTRGKMTVVGPIASAEVVAAVARAGLRAEPWTGDRGREDKSVLTLSTALSGVATLAGVAAGAFGGPRAPFLALAVAAGLWHVLPSAWRALRQLRPDMHLLMCVAVAGAIGLSEWVEAATVAFLYSLSLALESWSVGRARRAVEKLLELAPATATLVDGEREVPAGEVAPGTRVLVRPGARVALDGAIVEGSSSLDESALTGESLPRAKEPGDPVYAGSINGEGSLVVETTRFADDSTVAHMVRLVEAAGEKRSRSERWVERFARVYTPAVMAAALLVLVVPPLLFGGAWGAWFYRALVLLVIACPCALVISTPVSIVAALTAAARHGVLVKGGEHMETPARLATVALDKTGTLTRGEPRVVEVVALNGHTEQEVLTRAAALEARSHHPIALAVLEAAQERDGLPAAEEVRTIPGKGVEGVVAGKRYWVGSHRWLDELREEDERVRARLEALAGPGRSVLFVGSERHVCGLIAVADEMRADAREQVAALRAAGIARVVMLTGDNAPTAERIAGLAGIDEAHAELLPDQKVAAVAGLCAEGPTAMVGDGINDAPAMARADLGIAMGAGADIALEAADIALMRDDLSRLPWLVGHSKRTLAIIRQNVAASLAVKAAFVLLTLAGPASLWAAIAADMGVSLAVVFNALRLLR
jgi:Cd2+/Zn2+-exporting ATPase